MTNTMTKTLFDAQTLAMDSGRLNSKELCALQYHLKYGAGRKRAQPAPPSRALAFGVATHATLAQCAGTISLSGEPPDDLDALVRAELLRTGWAEGCAPEGDVADVLALAERGLSEILGYIGRGARVLATESMLELPYRGDGDGCPPFVLSAKVDLVLGHADGSIEHVDYKTGGSGRVDEVQNGVCRLLVGAHFGTERRTLSTTLFLGSGTRTSFELAPDEVRAMWARVKRAVREIATSEVFEPTRNPLCRWCPFYTDGCTLDPNERDISDVLGWLEHEPSTVGLDH